MYDAGGHPYHALSTRVDTVYVHDLEVALHSRWTNHLNFISICLLLFPRSALRIILVYIADGVSTGLLVGTIIGVLVSACLVVAVIVLVVK